MSQPTHTTSGAHEASAADQTQSAATPAKRRFRRTTARNKAAAPQAPQADQTATTTAATTAATTTAANEAHEAPQPSQLSHAAPTAETPAEHAQPAEAQAATPAKPQQKGTRATRGRRGGRKADVQLVVPPAPAAGAELPASAETPIVEQPVAGPTAVEAPRVVPVVTAPAEPTAATEPAVQPAAPAPRRYRFERRSPASAPTLTRPERITGATGTIAPAQPLISEQNPLAPPAEPEPTPEEEQPEAWQATVAEVAPETIDQNAAARSDVAPFDLRERATRQAVSDIVEALGLREGEQQVAERQHTLHLEPAQAAEAVEAVEAAEGELSEGDGEEAHAEQEGEAQGTSRRRRRRRRGGAHAVSTPDEEQHEPAAAEELPSPNGYDAYSDFGPFEQPYSPYNRPVRERPATLPAATAQPWELAAGSQQARQPESPFGSPEPSFARGFGPQPRGVAGPARESFARTQRTDRGLDTPPMSSNQLGAMVTHAIQQQTDRMLAELRHQPQPPSMTVTFPPFPSTERVGVFVDVANLLYSARGMRITLDFGKLLDFLRGNRRVIRAHAYAPTNPEPGAEQAFLSAVKGVGYRITTKNYKTFASGAKKADMDLDLCMDIVRMVDAKALDTVVLVSGDSDFLPLLEYCSDHGVRVEVAAFDDSAAMILRQSCDLFINLSVVPEIRL